MVSISKRDKISLIAIGNLLLQEVVKRDALPDSLNIILEGIVLLVSVMCVKVSVNMLRRNENKSIMNGILVIIISAVPIIYVLVIFLLKINGSFALK
jgi:hypothetical protein